MPVSARHCHWHGLTLARTEKEQFLLLRLKRASGSHWRGQGKDRRAHPQRPPSGRGRDRQVDGCVHVAEAGPGVPAGPLRQGSAYRVRVLAADGYDLVGRAERPAVL